MIVAVRGEPHELRRGKALHVDLDAKFVNS